MKRELKKQVEYCLKWFPETRDSDVTLMIKIWELYYPHHVLKNATTGEKGINIKSLYALPREDHIKRYRAKLQNDELKYLPTSLEVAKQRRIEEGVWRAQMGGVKLPPLNEPINKDVRSPDGAWWNKEEQNNEGN